MTSSSNVAGRRVREMLSGQLDAGRHHEVWDGRNDRGERAAAGTYFIQMRTGKQTLTQRIILAQ
jgi:flagellar hook assembly protein FlgD